MGRADARPRRPASGSPAARRPAPRRPQWPAAARRGWCTPRTTAPRCPATPVRSPGERRSGDVAVDEAADGVAGVAGAVRGGLRPRVLRRRAAPPVCATVHYERDYDNAFWDGTQLVFGDGDGKVFDRFTKPVDVLGHEFTHAVTEHTAGLVYEGQSGRAQRVGLRRLRLLPQAAAARPGRASRRDWLIGAGLFLPGRPGAGAARHGRTRHGVRRPGARQGPAGRPHGRLRRHHRRQRRRAPQLRHPQPRLPARRDRDRRHVVGGRRPDLVRRAHRRAGRGRAPTSPASRPPPSPRPASTPTRSREAWETVGVDLGAGTRRPGRAAARRPPTSRRVRGAAYRRLRRAGRRRRGRPRRRRPARPRAAPSWSTGSTCATVAGGDPQPDMFVYAFDLCGDRATVPEQHLTDDLRRVAELCCRGSP